MVVGEDCASGAEKMETTAGKICEERLSSLIMQVACQSHISHSRNVVNVTPAVFSLGHLFRISCVGSIALRERKLL